MAQLLNQFQITPEKGQMDLRFNPNTISCMVKDDEATPLTSGQAVKLVDSLDGVPKVTAVTADTDDIFGFVNFDPQRTLHPAATYLEVSAMRGNVMFMQSSAAIARGANVMVVLTGTKVATATAGKTVLGRAYDKASGADQLIRVIIDLPYALDSFPVAAVVAANATTVASDLATAIALANSLQTSVNAILTSLKNAGLMASA